MNHYFQSIRNNTEELLNFFKKMPKGADIHHHALGALRPADILKKAVGIYMIFKKSSYTYSFWAFFMDPDPDFRCSGSDLRKKSPFWFRTKEPGSETQQLVHRP